MSFISGIDPLSVIGPNISAGKVRTKAEAEKEFASVFVAQILKEIYKGQMAMFGDEEKDAGMFSNNLYNDIMMSKIAGEIADSKSFGFEKLMAK